MLEPETDGQVTRFATGEVIPGSKYVVDRVLGEGGHGVVYVVKNRDLPKKRLVAKVLGASLGQRKELVERMVREAQVLAEIEHPNIVAIVDAGMTAEAPPRPYLVMEHLDGMTLREVLDRSPRGLDIRGAVRIGIELCDALECAHARHAVIHRDVKPENVFLQRREGDRWTTKLLDFGVGHVLAGERENLRKPARMPA